MGFSISRQSPSTVCQRADSRVCGAHEHTRTVGDRDLEEGRAQPPHVHRIPVPERIRKVDRIHSSQLYQDAGANTRPRIGTAGYPDQSQPEVYGSCRGSSLRTYRRRRRIVRVSRSCCRVTPASPRKALRSDPPGSSETRDCMEESDLPSGPVHLFPRVEGGSSSSNEAHFPERSASPSSVGGRTSLLSAKEPQGWR